MLALGECASMLLVVCPGLAIGEPCVAMLLVVDHGFHILGVLNL